VLVSTFARTMLDRVHALAPEIATAFLTSRVPGPPDRLALFASLAGDGHAGVHPWWGLVDADVVADAHEAGLFVNVWTVDDPEAMARLVGWGVDGICTNVPDVAAEVLGRS
jgi:glycerophosphoryl diester phosphodiesterase